MHRCTNGIHSPPFSLQRETCQECPLSPLLFNIVIKPLAIWLHSHDGFQGRYGRAHKLSLYADNLLLFISELTSSLPPILSIVDEFGRLSGHKLNLQKSGHLGFTQSYFPLTAVICSQPPITAHKISNNPVVINSVKIWFQFRK